MWVRVPPVAHICMKKLDKLVMSMFYRYFISVFFLTYFIVLLSLLYDKLPIILSKNLGVKLYLQIIFYLMVFLTPYISVLSSMLGTILFITRFDYNLQLTAIKSLGIGFKRFIISLSMSFFFLSLLIGWFTNFLSPFFKKKCYDIFRNLENLDPSLNIKTNVFINDIPNLGVFVGDKSGGKLSDIVVYTHTNDMDSLFISENGSVSSDHLTKITSIELNNGFNYCEGPLLNRLSGTDKKNKVDIRNVFKNQNIYVDMKDINKFGSFYESLGDIDSAKIFKMLKESKASINTNINNIMGSLDKNYRDLFDEISEKKEGVLKRKIHKSLLDETFDSNVFDKADDLKSKNVNEFNSIKSQRSEIKRYYVEIFGRNMVILGCFLMLVIGTYVGFLLKRGVMIIQIIIGAIFVSIYFLGESLFVKLISLDSHLYLFRRSGGTVTILLLICFYLLFKLLLSLFGRYKKKRMLNKQKLMSAEN